MQHAYDIKDVFENDQAFNYWMSFLATHFREKYTMPELSEEGICRLEALIRKMRRANRRGSDPFTGAFLQSAVAYYGECMLHELGGQWTLNTFDVDEQGLHAVKLLDGNIYFPMLKMLKFIRNGQEDCLVSLYMVAKYDICQLNSNRAQIGAI